MDSPAYRALPGHRRFQYSPINSRPVYRWPDGSRLAVYIGFNIEHFAFGEGLGPTIGPVMPEPDVLNHAWREYALRVGAWRCLDLFDELALPTAAVINTALYDHCPELVAAFAQRGDELVAHGHTNSDTLNWCHDDQPTRLHTRNGQPLWAIPYPEEVNDIPMILARQMDAKSFADLVIDHFEEMLRQSARQPLVMGIALHAYLMGQPHRLCHLRRALEHIARARDECRICITTPGSIASHMDFLGR